VQHRAAGTDAAAIDLEKQSQTKVLKAEILQVFRPFLL
jgi:hypothetical protein